MQHGIARDGVHLAVGPAVGRHVGRQVGLLVQDVVPLQHHSEFLATQEGLRELGVPQEFVGIHRLVGIASLAEHVEVGSKFHAPIETDVRVTTVLEVPGGKVVRCLQAVLSAGIRRTTVEREVEHPDAIAETDLRRDIISMSDISVRNGRTVQVDITHAMVVASVDRAAHIPAVQRVETDIERHTEVGTPVTVDVLRFRYASTSGLVISHDITDGVLGDLPSTVGGETPVGLILGHGESHAVGHELLLTLHLKIETEIRIE